LKVPIHDWTRVDAGILHDFHNAWLTEIRNVLNNGTLPEGYYALTEQHAGRIIPDVLRLHVTPARQEPAVALPRAGVALADAPPQVRWKQILSASRLTRRGTLAVRHVSGHRLVALIEGVSQSNKDRADHVEEFAAKVTSALDLGIHVLVVDLFPPGRYDANSAVRDMLDDDSTVSTDQLPDHEPLSLVSYMAGPPIDAYLEQARVGQSPPDMPLFLQTDWYINVPLERDYEAAFQGEPTFWRDVLEGT
jgi:hypothetical protein